MKKPSINKNQPYALSGNKILINNDLFRSEFDKILLAFPVLAYKPPGKNEILKFIVSQDKMINHVLSQIKEGIYTFEVSLLDKWSGYMEEVNYTQDDGFKVRVNYIINLDEIIDCLAYRNKKTNKLLLKKIGIYTSKTFIQKLISKEKVGNNIKYSDILLMLSEEPNIFSNKLDSLEYGLEGSKLCELIEEIDWYKLSEGFISEDQRDNIQKNIYYLLYNYQEYEEMKEPFWPFNGDTGAFNLNEEIKEAIFNDMPEDFNETEKVYYIYRKLCQLFTYSEDNYPTPFTTKPMSPDKLGQKKQNDFVVCNEAPTILGNILEKMRIPFRMVGYDNHIMVNYYSRHLAIMIKTDEMIIYADPISRAIKNDVSASKFLHEARNFNVWGNNLKAKVDLERYKQKVDDYLKDKYVSQEQKEAAELMKALKETSKEGLSIKDKIDLAILYSRSIKLLPLDTIEWMDDLINEIFGGDRTYFDFKVMKKMYPSDSERKSDVCVCIAYNENGLDDTKNNLYQTIRQGKILDQFTYDELEESVENGLYRQTFKKMIDTTNKKEITR